MRVRDTKSGTESSIPLLFLFGYLNAILIGFCVLLDLTICLTSFSSLHWKWKASCDNYCLSYFFTFGVQRPRPLLEERRCRQQKRRALEQERRQRRVGVGFQHGYGRRRHTQPLGAGVVQRSRDLTQWVRKRVVRFLSFGAFECQGTPQPLWPRVWIRPVR